MWIQDSFIYCISAYTHYMIIHLYTLKGPLLHTLCTLSRIVSLVFYFLFFFTLLEIYNIRQTARVKDRISKFLPQFFCLILFFFIAFGKKTSFNLFYLWKINSLFALGNNEFMEIASSSYNSVFCLLIIIILALLCKALNCNLTFPTFWTLYNIIYCREKKLPLQCFN